MGPIISITGARGFVGKHLLARLGKIERASLRVMSRCQERPQFNDCAIFPCDLTESSHDLRRFVDGADVLIHCAGETRDVGKMRTLHVDGTAALLRAVKESRQFRQKPLHWVQLSSVGVYGASVQQGALRTANEEAPISPVGEYEETKAASDQLVEQASCEGIITHTIIRPSIVFGVDMPNQSLRQLASVVRRGLLFHIGRAGAVANYIHVDDVVSVLAKAAVDDRMRGQTYNLSNDCYVDEMISAIARGVGGKTPRSRLPEFPIRALVRLLPRSLGLPISAERLNALTSRTSYPSTKLQAQIGYKPSSPVPHALAKVVSEWMGTGRQVSRAA